MIDSKDVFDIKVKNTTISSDDMIDSLLQNQEVRDFIISNDLSQKEVENSINIFLEFLSDNIKQKDGTIVSKSLPGYKTTLNYENKKVSLKYVRLVPLKKGNKNISLVNLPETLKESSFSDFDLTTVERRKAYQYAKQFIDTFKIPYQNKGMYISGQFRSGKTYLASIIANEIAAKGYNVIEVYYPELSMMLKKSLNEDSEAAFYNLVEEMKTTDLLVLDDFGGEYLNPFIRDEVLGVVLNHRLNNKLPVIFTSNIFISKLMNTSLRKDDSDIELTKAERILSRIKELTEEFELFDKYEARKKERNYYED